jgi:2'-hydroxyisoflavone reductase
MQTRRDFVRLSVAAGAAVAAFGPGAQFAGAAQRRKGLKILVLGGTGFIGPAFVEAAKQAGHTLTIFNRGKTEKRLGTGRDDVEHLYGNRDPLKRADDADAASALGLSEIEARIKAGAKWDAVVDTSGFVKRIVKASADLLAPAAGQYLFISSISVYKSNDKPGEDESAELATTDATDENITNETYGAFKVQCEQAVEAAFPGKATQIRPGFIVGPGDPYDRFTYWAVRVAKGGPTLAPGAANDPVQFIDCRDLADFVLRCIEQKTYGVFNANGPAKPFTIGEMLNDCKKAAGSDASFEWVNAEFLAEQHVIPAVDVPIWVPPTGDSAGFHFRNVSKGVAAGMKFRTAADTAKAILEWWPKEVERRNKVGKQMIEDLTKQGKEIPPTLKDPAKLRAGLTPEREADLLKAWHEKLKATPTTSDKK